MTGRSAGVALLLTLLLAARGEELVEVPATTQVVVDRAGVVDAASAARITALLLRLRQLTTAEVKVLVVRTTSPEDIVGFSQRIFTQWRLGRAGADNGALIVLAVDDHHVRIHSGYGLEAVLPDSWCGSLSRATVSEHFRAGLYSQGLSAWCARSRARSPRRSRLTSASAPPSAMSRRTNRPRTNRRLDLRDHPRHPPGDRAQPWCAELRLGRLLWRVRRRRRRLRRGSAAGRAAASAAAAAAPAAAAAVRAGEPGLRR